MIQCNRSIKKYQYCEKNHVVDLEMGILDGPEEIAEFQEKIEKLIGGEERG